MAAAAICFLLSPQLSCISPAYVSLMLLASLLPTLVGDLVFGFFFLYFSFFFLQWAATLLLLLRFIVLLPQNLPVFVVVVVVVGAKV